MTTPPTPAKRTGGMPPVTVMVVAIVMGLLVVCGVMALAHDQPWLGLKLAPTTEAEGVTVVASAGPAAEIPVGTQIVAIAGDGGVMELEALDLVIEPDGGMKDFSTYQRFLDRQDQLARIQSSEEIHLTCAEAKTYHLIPSPRGRPLSSLPPDFWVQLVVGITAWLVSALVFAFRPRDTCARYLLLSGAATLLFSTMAALYSTRELALTGAMFRWANDLNFLGGSLFAASFVALLLYYPKRLAPAWAGIAVVVLYLAWFAAQQAGFFESMTFARRFLVLLGVAATLALAGLHWIGTRREPVARAALQWFLLSWMLGTSCFALFILLPQLFGVDTSPVQGYSFLLFLLVYGGLAFGILRYRLFDLGLWWRRAAIWTVTILLLVVLDMVFLFGLGMSSGISLSLTLLICGVVWLPLRAWAWNRFHGRSEAHSGEWFSRVMDVALAPSSDVQGRRWRSLLSDIFSPLGIEAGTGTSPEVEIGGDGLSMKIPAAGTIPSLRLEFAGEGRRLFSPQDVALAGELVRALAHAVASRSAYESGVAEERSRIARDIHDNIGAQLLAALHSADQEKKDSKIRESLEDLRAVINDSPSESLTLEETLAELRAESAERLESAGIALRWQGDGCDRTLLDAPTVHALRSIIREAVSNVIRHSGARQASVFVNCDPRAVAVEIGDDGRGCRNAEHRNGNGIANMKERLARLRGTLEITHPDEGTRLSIRIPWSPEEAEP